MKRRRRLVQDETSSSHDREPELDRDRRAVVWPEPRPDPPEEPAEPWATLLLPSDPPRDWPWRRR